MDTFPRFFDVDTASSAPHGTMHGFTCQPETEGPLEVLPSLYKRPPTTVQPCVTQRLDYVLSRQPWCRPGMCLASGVTSSILTSVIFRAGRSLKCFVGWEVKPWNSVVLTMSPAGQRILSTRTENVQISIKQYSRTRPLASVNNL